MRSLWLALPLLLVVSLDGAFTLMGQPPAYRGGTDYTKTNEGSQIGCRVLEKGPRVFAAGIAGLACLYLVLAKVLPGMLGQLAYGAAGLGHAWGSSSWVPLHATTWLRALGRRLGGEAGVACAKLSRWEFFGHYATTAYLVLVALVFVFCWRRAGLLPSAPARKPKTEKGKGA